MSKSKFRPESSPAPALATTATLTDEEIEDLKMLVATRDGAGLVVQAATNTYNGIQQEINKEVQSLKKHYHFGKDVEVDINVQTGLMTVKTAPIPEGIELPTPPTGVELPAGVELPGAVPPEFTEV